MRIYGPSDQIQYTLDVVLLFASLFLWPDVDSQANLRPSEAHLLNMLEAKMLFYAPPFPSPSSPPAYTLPSSESEGVTTIRSHSYRCWRISKSSRQADSTSNTVQKSSLRVACLTQGRCKHLQLTLLPPLQGSTPMEADVGAGEIRSQEAAAATSVSQKQLDNEQQVAERARLKEEKAAERQRLKDERAEEKEKAKEQKAAEKAAALSNKKACRSDHASHPFVPLSGTLISSA